MYHLLMQMYAGAVLFFIWRTNYTNYNQIAFTIEPYRHLMFVFPAALQHYVPPFYTDYERISISGNYVLQSR